MMVKSMSGADGCFYYHTFPMTSFISVFAWGGDCVTPSTASVDQYVLYICCPIRVCVTMDIDLHHINSSQELEAIRNIALSHLLLLIDVFIKYFHQ